MTDEPRTTSQDIEPAETAEPQTIVVVQDEMQLVINRARDLEAAELLGLLVEPRRP